MYALFGEYVEFLKEENGNAGNRILANGNKGHCSSCSHLFSMRLVAIFVRYKMIDFLILFLFLFYEKEGHALNIANFTVFSR